MLESRGYQNITSFKLPIFPLLNKAFIFSVAKVRFYLRLAQRWVLVIKVYL